jgi:phosphatidylglycerol---prolipoprotein diacylglyceryl transferase
MFPYLYQAPDGGVSLPSYGLLLMLAFVAGTTVGFFRLRKVGIHPDLLPGLVMIAVVLGIFGARLLHFLGSEPATLFKNPLVLLKLNTGGMAVYGGVLAASLGCFFFAKKKGANPWKLSDALLPCFFLALAVGRMGCTAAGCCHGAKIEGAKWSSLTGELFPGGQFVNTEGFPWFAAIYKEGVGVGKWFNVPVYPTQIWEMLGALCLFGLLSWTWANKRKFDGQIVAIGMMIYPLLRSSIEHFRGDSIRGVNHFGLMSTSQVVSLLVALCGLWIWRVRAPMGVSEETPIARESDSVDEELFGDTL